MLQQSMHFSWLLMLASLIRAGNLLDIGMEVEAEGVDGEAGKIAAIKGKLLQYYNQISLD